MRTNRPLSQTGLTLFLRKSPFICPTCAYAQATSQRHGKLSNAKPRTPNSQQKRHASSLASSTAINAAKETPARLQPLHDSLSKLRKDAASFINISRLQLAIRSLESGRPTIRLAVLGLPGQRIARQVARLLLADPLGEEGQWERNLDAFEGDDGRGLLLRYGDDKDPTPPNPSDTAIYVPSRVLQRHNLEVLVSSFNLSQDTPSDTAGAAEFRRAALIPTAESPSSFSGAVSFLTYPVHRALIVAEGLRGCLTLGKYTSLGGGSTTELDVTLKLASNLPSLAGQPQGNDTQGQTEVSIIDVAKAGTAMGKLRESISNSTVYEQLWNGSGLPELESWLSQGFLQEETGRLDPAIRATIDDVLSEASRTILAEEEVAQALESSDPPALAAVRQSFDEELQAWAARAHIELRDSLDQAFSDAKWAKLSWWKLFWRTDDVSMITTELLESSWLVHAEKSIIWLAGRSAQAGIPATPHLSTLKLPEESKQDATQPKTAAAAPAVSDEPPPAPWPTHIPAARAALEATTIPPMQSLSQALLIQTMSVSALTSVLSVLIYISFPSVSVYSAAAAGTLGVGWSLRRLQRIWERAREDWRREVRECGRVVLKDVEGHFRETVVDRTARLDESKADGLEGAGARDRRAARLAVEGVQSALDQIDGSGLASPRAKE